MLGFGDPKKRIVAIISGMKNEDSNEEHDYSMMMSEPMSMLLEALENKDVEAAVRMLVNLHDIMHGKHNNDYE